MAKPKIMFYHDGRHPLIYMYEPPMQKEEYEAAIDELVGTPIEALMFCLGDGRTFLHDTEVGELWGHNVARWPHLIFHRAHRNAVGLIRQGHDPLQIVCERAHAEGILVYPTLLVQQGCGDPSQDVRCSDFRFQNRHLEIGARGDLDPGFPGFHFLDFKHEEVRAQLFGVVAETLKHYAVDGFELQLNYGVHYFHPDEVDQGRQIMTEWIRSIYTAVKDSGAGRELAVRIPASVEGCYGLGMDVREWAQQGIVDVLIGQSYSGPELVDPMTDFRPLIDTCRKSSCRVHAAIHSHVDSDRLAEACIEMVRATACNYWRQGIDGIYLAHWFGNWPYQASFYEKLRELPHPDVMDPKDKFYFVPTVTGRYPDPQLEPGMIRQLPRELKIGSAETIDLRISDNLARWQAVGRVHAVILRLRILNTTELDRFELRLNGHLLPDSQLRKINEMYRMSAPRYRTGSAYWYVYHLDNELWPQQEHNTLEVLLTERDPDVIPTVSIRDVELETKYRMGKHYHRGQDADLGPYEYSSDATQRG